MNDKQAATAAALHARVKERVGRGMSRDRALMLSVMELGGKITIVRGVRDGQDSK